jgi:hypothetical protein
MQQMEARCMSSVTTKIINVPEELLSMCKDELDAVRLCVQLSRLPHERVRDALGVDKGHWSRMMQGRAHFPTRKLCELMDYCGNRAPLQYMAQRMGLQMYEDAKAKRKAELEAELRSLAA